MIELDDMANHSFMCFEKEVIHEEVIKINKMIVKLSISCANLKTKLGRRVITIVSPIKMVATPKKTCCSLGTPVQQARALNFTDTVEQIKVKDHTGTLSMANRQDTYNENDFNSSDFGSPYSARSSASMLLKVQRSSTSESIDQLITCNDQNNHDTSNHRKEKFSLEDLARVERPQQPQIHEEYEYFVNRNLFNFMIIKKYCEEITAQPFEAMMATDMTVGRWLDEEISTLQSTVMSMGRELSKYKIDTSILDIYRNLLIMVGKRYALLDGLMVS
jgi:hypothetical protein